MKRALLLCLCLLFLCGCAHSSGDYERGYADGYAAAMSDLSRTVPDITPVPTTRAAVTPRPAPTPSTDDFTIYISNSGTMHKKSNCSGMKHYTEMPYSIAKDYYTKKCSKCFK